VIECFKKGPCLNKNQVNVKAVFFALMLALVSQFSSQALAAGPVKLNFKDAEIDSVVGAFGHWLNRTFIIDPRVRGKITLETPRAVKPEEGYRLLQSALRLQGFSMVESGGLVRVVPELDAKLQPGPVSVGNLPTTKGDAVVTQIFRLNYESATAMIPVLQPFISPNNKISAMGSSNALVVTDYASNMQRLARMIATLDSPSTNEVEIVPVRHAIASDLAVVAGRLLDDASRGGAPTDAGQRVSIFADPRLNSIMIRSASPARVNLAKSLIARLDQPTTQPGNVNVVYLRNADAVKMAEILRSVLTGEGGNTAATAARAAQPAQGGAQGTAAANQPGAAPAAAAQGAITVSGGGATIAADPSSNALIITASEAVYRNIRSVIDRLDARRAQVYIETLIVEVTAENAAEFGIQWQSLTKNTNKTYAVGGTNFGPPQGNIVSGTVNAAAAIATGGLNLGIIRNAATTLACPTGKDCPGLNLGLLIRALEKESKVNILATPNLVTMDNEEARIVIGQNVPFVTGQYAAQAGTAGANPFQTIERKDVGTTLRVKPQVSESGTIRLQIFQESSSLGAERADGQIITNRRAIETNVLADDGQIVVLGGLIEDRSTGANEKVPGLGNIPIIGNLFKFDQRKREKTNLLVFLRPVVIRTADDSYSVTADRYDYMKQVQGDLRVPNHWLLPDVGSPTLPNMPPRPGDNTPSKSTSGSIAPSIAPSIDLRQKREQEGAAQTTAPMADKSLPDAKPSAPSPLRGEADDGSAPPARGKMIRTAPNEVYVQLPADKAAPPDDAKPSK
jgi:general secretion pathway protein D